MYRKIIITTALLAGLGAAQADTGFGLASGSTGYDIFAASKINPHVDLITGYHSYHGAHQFTDASDNDITVDLEMDAFRIGLQLFPFPKRGFHVEIGAFSNAPDIALSAAPDAQGNVRIGAGHYQHKAIGGLTGEADFDRQVAPYLMLGWGRSTAAGFGLDLSLGLIDYGAPKVALRSGGCDLPAAQCTHLVRDIKKEETRINKELAKHSVYPVARLGMSWSF